MCSGRSLFQSPAAARALLAYLAMHPDRLIHREELSDLLWDVRKGRDTRHNLRQCLVDLRKMLDAFPGLLTIERDAVSLNSQLCQVDALLFADLVEAGELDRATTLHHGEFLKGLNISAEAFAAWIGDERVRIAAIAERLFEQTVQSSLSSGDGRNVIAAAERLVALDPLHENWQRLLIDAYARFRGRHTAIIHGRKLVESLKRDLDVAPEPETLALLDQIRIGSIKPLVHVDSLPIAG